MKESIMSNTVNQQTSNNTGEKIKNEESNHPKKQTANKRTNEQLSIAMLYNNVKCKWAKLNNKQTETWLCGLKKQIQPSVVSKKHILETPKD